MKVIENNKSQRFVYFVVLNTLLLTAAVFAYEFIPFGSLLIQYSTSLMVLFLATGFIGFYYRINPLIFFNFSACIVLCSVLRTLPSQEGFSNSPASSDITVAHFVLEDSQSLADFVRYQPSVKADFMSIQTASNNPIAEQLSTSLEHQYPFRKVSSYNKGFNLYVFSAFQLKNLDTIIDPIDNSISIFGSIFLDSSFQEISFLSSPLLGEKASKRTLNLLSNFSQEKLKGQPFLTLSNAQMVSNRKDFERLQSIHSLKDSQPTHDQAITNGRIFYSKDLVCTKFQKSCQGNCVIASYRIKRENLLTLKSFTKPSMMAGAAL